MPLIYTTVGKTARMNAVVTALGANAKLKLWSSANVLLAVFTLATIAGTVSGSVITLSDANGATAGILNTLSVAAGTAVKATMTTSADVEIVTEALTVGITGADINLDSNVFTLSQGVTINNAVLTHA